ncbi:TetR/AcrR family transcriptional regulator [Actinokineospora sp.]|uniref:TetR/AcrR family transcriptional regulator n=1 Tax=Actinokineospora sp. TaxID=1872133 RepID=UPI00403796B4
MVRADSVRNRCKILDATRRLLSTRGNQVGMDEIASHAGVAVGTLYRHFPTKADLIDATVAELSQDLVTRLAAAADRVAAGADPIAELGVLLREFTEMAANDRAVKAAATGLAAESLRQLEERGLAQLQRIIDAARARGLLHPDITTADLALLVATAPSDTVPAVARERWLQLALRSLTP